MEQYNDFKKKFGQNFLSDKNLLSAICRDANVTQKDDVLEIGAGSGALTEILCNVANKVVSYEIDKDLTEILTSKFSNKNNVTIIFADALKTDIKQIENQFKGKYKLVANIPYYITTPLIFKFLETATNLSDMTLMVQKEVAERICALPNTSNYGALSVICQYFCDCKIARTVSKKLFKPMPKVDSAIIRLNLKQSFNSEYSYLVRNSFAMRRKTLYNNLLSAYQTNSDTLQSLFQNTGFDPKVRAENLSFEDFQKILEQINKLDIKH